MSGLLSGLLHSHTRCFQRLTSNRLALTRTLAYDDKSIDLVFQVSIYRHIGAIFMHLRKRICRCPRRLFAADM